MHFICHYYEKLQAVSVMRNRKYLLIVRQEKVMFSMFCIAQLLLRCAVKALLCIQVITVPDESSVQSSSAPPLQKVQPRPEIIEEIMAQEQAVTGMYIISFEYSQFF